MMFDTAAIKNKKRSCKDRIVHPTEEQVHHVNSHERVLPYFEIVPAQLAANKRYLDLTRQEQGDFLRLVIQLWRGGGAHLDHPRLAKDLGMEKSEWLSFKEKLLGFGLLIMSDDEDYIIQPELRRQYLLTKASCEAMTRTETRSAPENTP